MPEFTFRYLQKQDYNEYESMLFEIFYTNMTVLAPTGNSRDEDFRRWSNTFGDAFVKRMEWEIVLIESDGIVIGFFAYSCKDNTFQMQEIQFSEAYKGKYGVFRKLYSFVTEHLPTDLLYVEAYAYKNNAKSIAVLTRLGLTNTEAHPSGRTFHFKGTYEDYLSWLNR